MDVYKSIFRQFTFCCNCSFHAAKWCCANVSTKHFTVDSFVTCAFNYRVDRKHIFTAAQSIHFGPPFNTNAIVKQVECRRYRTSTTVASIDKQVINFCPFYTPQNGVMPSHRYFKKTFCGFVTRLLGRFEAAQLNHFGPPSNANAIVKHVECLRYRNSTIEASIDKQIINSGPFYVAS